VVAPPRYHILFQGENLYPMSIPQFYFKSAVIVMVVMEVVAVMVMMMELMNQLVK
jgi:5-methylthioribose kinase